MNYADTSILAGDADLYASVSELPGHTETAREYRQYAKRVREAFTEEYVSEDGHLGQEMQGNYILALKYHMVPKEKEPMLVWIRKEFQNRFLTILPDIRFWFRASVK